MIVVAIIGILAAIALPRFANLLRKSAEGSTKGNLGTLRSTLNIYYADMEGQYPSNLLALTSGQKYLAALPTAKTPDYHPDTSAAVAWNGGAGDDSGGWMYDGVPADVSVGSVLVNCLHTDAKGSNWTAY